MSTRIICLLALLTPFLLGSAGAGGATVSARGMTLGDILQATVQRQQGNPSPPPFQSSSWLSELPSVGLSYLDSDEREGTDETELTLNLPFKSPFLRRQDKILRSVAQELASEERQRRLLYFSGLIREAGWSWRIADTRVDYTRRKIRLLQELLERQQALFDAYSSSRYNLLLIRQELADARVLLADEQLEVDTWAERFRYLTGQGSLPQSIEEPGLPTDSAWQAHPELRLLELGWDQQRALIAANSAAGSAWNVALQAKRLESPGFEEDQFGVALELPLSVFGTASESSTSEWRQASNDYWRRRDELHAQLSQSAVSLQAKSVYLRHRQAQLDESARISTELLQESRSLLEQNELGGELWVRRMLGDLDRQADAAINQLLIGQNVAMSRQAAGIPL